MMSGLAGSMAQLLIEISAVGITLDAPITFKSGILSPVYTDNRRLPYYPAAWKQIIAGFQQLIQQENLTFDVIAGIEAAGIPHSAALGYALEIPSVFVRKEAKGHGKKNRVEGGNVSGKRVLLIEDLVTTGSSSLAGVEALRDENAIVDHCLAITSYGFAEAERNFSGAQVKLHTLTSFQVIWAALKTQATAQEISAIEDWISDPFGWAERR